MKYIIDMPDTWRWSYDYKYKTLQIKFCGEDFGVEVTVNAESYAGPVKKQPKAPPNQHFFTCPSCGKIVKTYYDYCPYCGQAIDWRVDEWD